MMKFRKTLRSRKALFVFYHKLHQAGIRPDAIRVKPIDVNTYLVKWQS